MMMVTKMNSGLFTMIILIVCCLSCTSDTNQNKDQDITFTPSELEANYNELTLDKDNTSKYYLDGEVKQQKSTTGNLIPIGNKEKYMIASYSGSKGYFVEISVKKGGSPIGEHAVDKDSGNRLILNYFEDDIMTVYGSAFCMDSNPGKVVIDTYKDGVITGHFTVTTCNVSSNGLENKKTIHNAKFSVRLTELKKK